MAATPACGATPTGLVWSQLNQPGGPHRPQDTAISQAGTPQFARLDASTALGASGMIVRALKVRDPNFLASRRR